MAKVLVTTGGVYYNCVACGRQHGVPVNGSQAWEFNGDVDNPTLTPGLRTFTRDEYGNETTYCHHSVTAGQITYTDDCAHAYAGQTLTLTDV